jgi:DNA polymerase
MTDDYARVLEATERQLQSLKASGVRFLTVESETLRQLREAPTAPAQRGHAASTVAGGARALPATAANEFFERAAKSPPERIAHAAAPEVGRTPAPLSLPTPAAAAPAAAETPETALAALRTRAALCVKCPHLAASRKNVVFGVGDIHAALMFVGEAPGADEDRQGEPFVGAAGQLLTRIIKTMGFGRENVYIANVLKCRPDTPGQITGNRKPTGDEMKTCLPYLLEQIDLIHPKVIVALGATAVEGLLGKTEPIGKQRGRFQDFRGIPLMPTFHPSYLLRNQALTEKRKVWEDMLKVMEKLNLPITEKQRGYFSKAG